MDRNEYGHLSYFKVPLLFSASKNRLYREHILMKAEAIAKVFTSNALSNEDLYVRFKDKPEEFTKTMNDLTDEGVEFARSNFQKWLGNTLSKNILTL